MPAADTHFYFRGCPRRFGATETEDFHPGGDQEDVRDKAIIETKFGNVELKFFPEVAPNHVNNFIELAKKGVYDGTTFHRVIPGFMIQGGDPNSTSPTNPNTYGRPRVYDQG